MKNLKIFTRILAVIIAIAIITFSATGMIMFLPLVRGGIGFYIILMLIITLIVSILHASKGTYGRALLISILITITPVYISENSRDEESKDFCKENILSTCDIDDQGHFIFPQSFYYFSFASSCEEHLKDDISEILESRQKNQLNIENFDMFPSKFIANRCIKSHESSLYNSTKLLIIVKNNMFRFHEQKYYDDSCTDPSSYEESRFISGPYTMGKTVINEDSSQGRQLLFYTPEIGTEYGSVYTVNNSTLCFIKNTIVFEKQSNSFMMGMQPTDQNGSFTNLSVDYKNCFTILSEDKHLTKPSSERKASLN